MALHHNPRIVTSGLVLSLDAGDVNSYPGSGTTWYDVSGNSRHATLLNGINSGDKGSMLFDGSNQYATLDSFTLSTEWTILYWFYHDESGNNAMTIGEYNTNGNRFYHRDAGVDYKLRVHNNNVTNVQDMNLGDIRQQWAHLGYSINNNNGTVKGWVNGIEALNTSNAAEATFVVDSIGFPYTATSYMWKGNLTGILIYNRQLTTDEYIQNYLAQKTRFGL